MGSSMLKHWQEEQRWEPGASEPPLPPPPGPPQPGKESSATAGLARDEWAQPWRGGLPMKVEKGAPARSAVVETVKLEPPCKKPKVSPEKVSTPPAHSERAPAEREVIATAMAAGLNVVQICENSWGAVFPVRKGVDLRQLHFKSFQKNVLFAMHLRHATRIGWQRWGCTWM